MTNTLTQLTFGNAKWLASENEIMEMCEGQMMPSKRMRSVYRTNGTQGQI